MTPELKAKWVAALRSGDYKQCRGNLRVTKRDGDTYCCLGVLCTITGQKWNEGYAYNEPRHLTKNRHVGMPWIEMCQEIDLDPNFAQRVAHMNDEGSTFNYIADYIEGHYTGIID